MNALIPWLVLLPCLFAAQSAESRKADPQKDMAELARNLDAALAVKNNDKARDLIRAFAAAHGSAQKTVELVSADQKVQVLIGPPGTTAHPDAPEVNLTPKGTAYSIAIGGTGGQPAQGAGGKGGTVWLKGKVKGKVLLVGGTGGPGANATDKAPGGSGGTGGDVWFGAFGVGPVTSFGGAGGAAGAGTATQAGGAGGNGGSTGAEPPKKG